LIFQVKSTSPSDKSDIFSLSNSSISAPLNNSVVKIGVSSFTTSSITSLMSQTALSTCLKISFFASFI
jgi:hypothetical protein